MMQTRPSLLIRIRDPNDSRSWSEFVEIYAPLLHGYAMRRGLQDADAADLAQDTLRNVLRAAPSFQYDPAKGTFRGWLLTVARNEIRKLAAKNARRVVGSGDSGVREMIESLPDESSHDPTWEVEYRRRMFRVAADRVKPEFREATWDAFWRSTGLDEPVDKIAVSLNMTRGAVYIARSRVAARIRREIAAIEGNDL